MILQNLTNKTKCDFTGCKNMADFALVGANDAKKKMCLCETCIKNIYCAYAKLATPKGVDAPFKKQKKLR